MKFRNYSFVLLFLISFYSLPIQTNSFSEQYTLAPVASDPSKLISNDPKIQTLITSLDEGGLKLKELQSQSVMGFTHFDLEDSKELLGFSLQDFFPQHPQKPTIIRLLKFSGKNIGIVLLNKKDASVLEHRAFPSPFKGDVPVEDLFESYVFFQEQQKLDPEERVVFPVTEMEDSPDWVKRGGGKSASLGELAKAYGTAEGYIVTDHALKLFFEENPKMREEVQRLMYEVDTQNAEEREAIASTIHDLMVGKNKDFPIKMPKIFLESLNHHYKILNHWMAIQGLGIKTIHQENLAVASRSSGLGEDEEVSGTWIKTTSGSEAGIGSTALGVRGMDNLQKAILEVWASNFTDRSFGYREQKKLISWMSKIGQDEFNWLLGLIETQKKSGSTALDFPSIFSALNEHKNPGYLRVKQCFKNLIESFPKESKRLQGLLNSYEEAISEVKDLSKLGQGVAILRQLDSISAGTAFTALTGTGFTGSHLQYKMDNDGRVMAVEIDIAQKQGEGVVSNLTTPDHFELVRVPVSPNDSAITFNYKWVITHKTLGSKEIQVVLLDRLFYDEKNPNGKTELLDSLFVSKSSEENKEQVLMLSGNIYAALAHYGAKLQLKAQFPKLMQSLLEKNASHELIPQEIENCLSEQAFNDLPDLQNMNDNKKRTDARIKLSKILSALKTGTDKIAEAKANIQTTMGYSNLEQVDTLLGLVAKEWEKKKFTLEELSFLNSGAKTTQFLINTNSSLQFSAFAMLSHPDWFGKGTVAISTPPEVRENFVVDDETIKKIADILATIGEHYARKNGPEDKRDLEWAMEKLPGDGGIPVNIRDISGILDVNGKVEFKPLQARPVTSKLQDASPFVLLKTTEVKDTNLSPFVTSQVRGEGAVNVDHIYFVDDGRTLGEQEDEIKELVKQGFNVAVVIKFGGPQHDPLMSVSKGVLTEQGGATSHVAIYTREMGIVAVTGIGELGFKRLQEINEKAKKDKIQITIDANNGRLYEGKIPIIETATTIKVPFLPENSTKVGLILGAPSLAQKLSNLSQYLSGYGISLARGEFIAEAMGIYPKAARALVLWEKLNQVKNASENQAELSNFQKETLPLLDAYLNQNPSHIDLFKKWAALSVTPDTIPSELIRSFEGIKQYFEWYLKSIQLEQLSHVHDTISVSPSDLRDLELFQKWAEKNPNEFQEILDKIKGFSNAENYVEESIGTRQSALALSLNLLQQVNQNRAFDNKPNELKLLGAEAFSPPIHQGKNLTPSQKANPYNNPLIGLRGISLLTRPEQEKAFDLLLRPVFESVKNGVINQGFMTVFVRTPRELRLYLEKMDSLEEEYKVLPKEVGVMVEVPSNLYYAKEFTELMMSFREKHQSNHPGLEVYFSFGTNDFLNLNGTTDRDDPNVQVFEILDLNLKHEKILLANESAQVFLEILSHVIHEARNPENLLGSESSVKVGLCGELFNKLLAQDKREEARSLARLLNSLGVSHMNYRRIALLILDSEAEHTHLQNSGSLEKLTGIDVTKSFETQGYLNGEVVRVSRKEDLIPEEFANMNPDEKAEQVRKDPWKATRLAQKIVVIDGPLGSPEDLNEKRDENGNILQTKIDWSDLYYAKAILVDTTHWTSSDEVLNEEQMKKDLGILQGAEMKDRVKFWGSFSENELHNGDPVTLDYKNKAILKGDAVLQYSRPSSTPLSVPLVSLEQIEKIVEVKQTFSTGNLYRSLKQHPLKILETSEGEKSIQDKFEEVFKDKKFLKTKPILWIPDTLDRAELYDLKDGPEMEGTLNENPRFGLRDSTRNLGDFWKLHHLQLEFIKKKLEEGYIIHYQISNLKGAFSDRILEETLKLLVKLREQHPHFKVGVNIQNGIDVQQASEYLKSVDFLKIDFENLAYNLNALDPLSQKVIETRDGVGILFNDELETVLPKPFRVILGALKEANKPLYIEPGEYEPGNILYRIQKIEKKMTQYHEIAKILRALKESESLKDESFSELKARMEKLALSLNTLSYRLSYDKENLSWINDNLFTDSGFIIFNFNQNEKKQLKALKVFFDKENRGIISKEEQKFLNRSEVRTVPVISLVRTENPGILTLGRHPSRSAA